MSPARRPQWSGAAGHSSLAHDWPSRASFIMSRVARPVRAEGTRDPRPRLQPRFVSGRRRCRIPIGGCAEDPRSSIRDRGRIQRWSPRGTARNHPHDERRLRAREDVDRTSLLSRAPRTALNRNRAGAPARRSGSCPLDDRRSGATDYTQKPAFMLYTQSMALHRSQLLKFGGFDERIQPSAEDNDLSYCWLRAGRLSDSNPTSSPGTTTGAAVSSWRVSTSTTGSAKACWTGSTCGAAICA